MAGDWKRLAELAIARRVELGYHRRAKFARARGLSHDRTLSDLENAKRTNFEPATIAQIEQIYQWAPGSVRAVLDGGNPTPIGHQSPPLPGLGPDPVDEWIEEITETSLPDGVKTALIAQLELLRTQREAL